MLSFECYHTYCNKKLYEFHLLFLFFTILANFHFFLKIIPLSGVYCEVLRWKIYFSYGVPIGEIMQISISFLFKEFFCLWKKVVIFIFKSVKEDLDAIPLDTWILSSFLEKLMLVFVFLLIYFTIQHLEYIQDEVRHTASVQQVPHFCHPSWFFVRKVFSVNIWAIVFQY